MTRRGPDSEASLLLRPFRRLGGGGSRRGSSLGFRTHVVPSSAQRPLEAALTIA